jgi:hypothetical protein
MSDGQKFQLFQFSFSSVAYSTVVRLSVRHKKKAYGHTKHRSDRRNIKRDRWHNLKHAVPLTLLSASNAMRNAVM